MLLACRNHFLEASYTVWICFGALQEAAVAADCVAHTVLCCAMEFW